MTATPFNNSLHCTAPAYADEPRAEGEIEEEGEGEKKKPVAVSIVSKPPPAAAMTSEEEESARQAALDQAKANQLEMLAQQNKALLAAPSVHCQYVKVEVLLIYIIVTHAHTRTRAHAHARTRAHAHARTHVHVGELGHEGRHRG